MLTKEAGTATRAKGTNGSLTTILAIAVGVVAAYLAYSWWFSDERAIRNQLSTIAAAVSVQPNEGSLGLVARAATLRKALAPDVRIVAGTQAVETRDAVIGLATRWIAPAGGLTVEFDDVQVKVADGRTSADVYCTVKLTTRDPRTGERSIDAREVSVGFAKQDGVWVVSAARTENTLAR